MYVDDVTGSDNLSEARRLQEEITHILGRGFTLHKWCANLLKVYQSSYENLTFMQFQKP
jgi:hypothetical protein